MADGYKIWWDHSQRKIKVRPSRVHRGDRRLPFFFGLGNALIRLNLDTPPTELTVPITGDSSADGMLPTSAYHLKRWYAAPVGMSDASIQLTMYNGEHRTMNYKEADSTSIKEVSAADILQNGYGSTERQKIKRLNW